MRKYLLTGLFFTFCFWFSNAQYCDGGPTQTGDTNITELTLVGENESELEYTGCPGVLGVEDLTSQVVELIPGNTYTLNATLGSCSDFTYTSSAEFWIDFNQDEEFQPEESLGTGNLVNGDPANDISVTFTVPLTAVSGTTRLRALHREGATPPLDPCAEFAYGSITDFAVDVETLEINCQFPTDIVADVLSDSEVDLTWDGNAETEWNVEYGAEGFEPGAGEEIGSFNVFSESLSIDGLNANTVYKFAIQAVCENENSFWNAVTTTTNCGVEAVPFYENFDGDAWVSGAGFNNAGGEISPCWTSDPDASPDYFWGTRLGTTGGTFGTGPSGDFSGSGKYIYVESSNGSNDDEATITTPLIDANALTTPALSFYYHMRGANIGTLTVEAKAESDTEWTEFFTLTGEQQANAADPWEQVVVTLEGLEQEIIQVRFKTAKEGGNGDLAIDEVRVFEAPTCFDVEDLTTAATSADSATFSWADYPDAIDGFIWEVYLSDTEIDDNDPLFEGTVDAGETSFTVTGLDADTNYVFVLISDCGEDDGLSFQNASVEFATACDVTDAPFTEDFNGEEWVTGAAFNNDGDQINQCWTRDPDSSPAYFWGTGTGTTGSNFGTGPSGDVEGTGNYVFVESSNGGSGDVATINSPLINTAPLTTPALEFHYHMRGADIGTLTVEAKASDDTEWTEVFTISGAQQTLAADPWEQVVVSLDAFTDQVVQVRFQTTKSGVNGDLSIDNFAVVEAPSCFNVTGFSVAGAVTEATASWTEISSAVDGYTLEVYNEADEVGVDTPFVSEDLAQEVTSFEITGLTENTNYIATIISNCGADDFGDLIILNFSTVALGDNCEAAIEVESIPYNTTDDTANYSDFYNGSPGPNCGTSTASYLNGNDVVYTYTPDEDETVLISLDPNANYAGVFLYESCEDIGNGCINGITFGFSQDEDNFEANLDGGQTYYIVISTWAAPQTVGYELNINPVDCGAVSGFEIESFGSDSVDLVWDAVPGAVGYNWIIVEAGDDPEDEGDIVESGDTTDTFVSVEDIGPSTSYDVYVRSECLGDIFGNLAGPLNFQTDCVPESVPTSNEDFADANFNYNSNTQMPCWSEGTGTLNDSMSITDANGTWGAGNYANTAGLPNGQSARVNLFGTGTSWLVSQQVDLGDNPEDLVIEYDVSVVPWGSGSIDSPQVTDMGQHSVSVVVSTDGGITWSDEDIVELYDNTNIPSPSQKDYVSLEGYSGIVKIGFYANRVASADLWFAIDNFRILPEPTCFAPQGLTISEIGLDSALASWDLDPDATGGYIIEVYNEGDEQGVDTPILNQTLGSDIDSILIDGLIEGSEYEVYLFADCGVEDGVSVSAEFGFSTANIGDNCEAAIQIEDLPYTTSDSTSNYDNNYSGVPGTECGTTSAYLNQNDVVYSYLAEENGGLDITLTDIVGTYASVFVYDSCSEIGQFCLDGGVNPFVAGDQPDIELIEVPVVAGEEYFIVISHWFGTNIDYTLEIDFISCSRPNELDSQIVGAGEIELIWNGTGNETQWEVEYGLADSSLGDQDNVRVVVDEESLFLDDLPSATNHRFWVRAVCDLDSEEYSAWVGPEPFRSPIVPILIPSGEMHNEVYCYGNFEFTEWLFVSDADPIEEILMDWNTGSVEEAANSDDVLRIYDGFSEDGILLWDTEVDGSDLSDQSFVATTGAFYMILTTDIVQSCEGGQGELPAQFDIEIYSPTFSTPGFAEDEFSLYPNPVESTLNIQSANTVDAYELFNMRGQRLQQGNPNSNSPRVDMQDLPTGVYLLKVTVNGASETFQVIKK